MRSHRSLIRQKLRRATAQGAANGGDFSIGRYNTEIESSPCFLASITAGLEQSQSTTFGRKNLFKLHVCTRSRRFVRFR